MFRALVGRTGLLALGCVLLASLPGWAQQASGIAGLVTDTSGGILPGVTVEVRSPALIEGGRTVYTDGQGRFNVVDLRPGTYSVTFTLPGFSTFVRDGIELTGGFTATVNADMQVGAIEETVTVSGAAPLVDTQNVRQQSLVRNDVLNVLPTATQNVSALILLVPGMRGTTDVGGSSGTYSTSGNSVSFRGKTGRKYAFDGMQIQNLQGPSAISYILNQALIQETVVETGGLSAESASSGITVNAVPKEGGNTFRGGARGLLSTGEMQSDNFSDALRARGLRNVNEVEHIYDAGATLGGPIAANRLWFFSGVRAWGNRNIVPGIFHNSTQGTPFYTPDFSRPAFRNEWYQSYATRLTWQASQKNKVAFFVDFQNNCDCRREGNFAPESMPSFLFWPQGLFQATWSSPVTSRLLFEAGWSLAMSHYSNPLQPGVSPNDVSITEQSTGLRYNAGYFLREVTFSDRYAQRFAVSYVTGSHAFKAGVDLQQGVRDQHDWRTQQMEFRFNNGVPNRITQWAYPFMQKDRMKADLGIFVQDQWAIRRFTLNYGLRFDYLNAYVPEQRVAPTPFVPFERHFAPVHKVPAWSDLNPRLGVAYDVFGDGRTALKLAVGRYLNINALDIAGANNPLTASVTSANRSWVDANRDYAPDCDLLDFGSNGECGPIDNVNFGRNNPRATRWSDEVLRGFGTRDYLWDVAAEVQQELAPGLSVYGGYYRSWYNNFRVTDNLAITPADFDPYCITAPTDPRLPGGGGYEVCGLYNIKPSKFGQSENLVTKASNFGKQTRLNNFVSVGFNARFDSGARLGGGVDAGRITNDTCYVVDSPQQLLYCRHVMPWAANLQVKVNGSYPLPGGFVVSGVFQNVAGPEITAAYAVANAQVARSLGRNLAGGARTVTVPLMAPNTQFEDRTSQLDVRVGKLFRVGAAMSLQANLDVYNAFNANSIINRINNYGPQWGRPTRILDGRLLQVSGSLTF